MYSIKAKLDERHTSDRSEKFKAPKRVSFYVFELFVSVSSCFVWLGSFC